MKFDLDISGIPEVQKALDELPKRLQTVVLQAALRKAAQPILQQTRSNLASYVRVTGKKTDPIWTGLRIGTGGRKRRRGVVSVQVMSPTRARLGISPTDKWYYPAHIELGTRHTPALPFMRPALESQRDHATQIILQELRKGIEAIAEGVIRRRSQ